MLRTEVPSEVTFPLETTFTVLVRTWELFAIFPALGFADDQRELCVLRMLMDHVKFQITAPFVSFGATFRWAGVICNCSRLLDRFLGRKVLVGRGCERFQCDSLFFRGEERAHREVSVLHWYISRSEIRTKRTPIHFLHVPPCTSAKKRKIASIRCD